MSDGTGGEDWKYRYLDAIEELEKRELEWQASEQFLRRGLGRIALVSHGIDTQLDTNLEQLRKALQEDASTDQLAEHLDRVSSHLKSLDDRSVETQGAQETPGLRLEDLLLELLECLSFPAEYAVRVQSLKQHLIDGIAPESVKGVTHRVIALVSEMRSTLEEEKNELERFLFQLTRRLYELDSMVEGAESQRKSTIASGKALDSKVEAKVSDIEATVNRATDLDQVKVGIQVSLDSIRLHLEQRQHQEEEYHHELELQLKSLNSRLQEMEQESELLHRRLEKEKAQALTDPLTGAPNRLAYEQRILQEFSRWQRYDNPLTLILWDVDHFKSINDGYGHKAGDRALKAIVQVLLDNLRAADFLARIGGEEFVVILPETSVTEAQPVAEKLRIAVELCDFRYQGQSVPVTLSGGIAQFVEGNEIDAVYQRADRALYRAKEAGRNQCEIDE